MVDNAPFTGEWAGVGVQMLFAVMALGLGLLFAFALGGPLATGMRCYAMHFYGGRYPALGEKLAELERAQMQDAPPEP